MWDQHVAQGMKLLLGYLTSHIVVMDQVRPGDSTDPAP